MLTSTRGIRKDQSTHEVIVTAADSLRGARITTHTEGRDRGATETNQTFDGGKNEPEQSTELAERRGARLYHGHV